VRVSVLDDRAGWAESGAGDSADLIMIVAHNPNRKGLGLKTLSLFATDQARLLDLAV